MNVSKKFFTYFSKSILLSYDTICDSNMGSNIIIVKFSSIKIPAHGTWPYHVLPISKTQRSFILNEN